MNPQIPLLLAFSVTDRDIDRCVAVARRAEEAGVAAVVLLDPEGGPSAEPTTVLARIAAVTERIGLIGTFAAGANDSLELARRLADLDHLSGGRIGWRVSPGGSRRGYFGSRQLVTPGEQEIADARVVGSVVERWSLRTELRSPQGVPVVVADGAARFAPGLADVVLLDEPHELAGIRSRVCGLGRDAAAVKAFARINVAGDIESWPETGAVDGFFVQPDSPDSLEKFLSAPGRTIDLESRTLRQRLGLSGPAPIPTTAPIVSLVGIR